MLRAKTFAFSFVLLIFHSFFSVSMYHVLARTSCARHVYVYTHNKQTVMDAAHQVHVHNGGIGAWRHDVRRRTPLVPSTTVYTDTQAT